MRMLLKLFVVLVTLGAFAAHAANQMPPAEKPGQLERSVTKAGKAMERTGDRAAKSTANGLDRAGKAVGRTVDKSVDWVKKKTE